MVAPVRRRPRSTTEDPRRDCAHQWSPIGMHHDGMGQSWTTYCCPDCATVRHLFGDGRAVYSSPIERPPRLGLGAYFLLGLVAWALFLWWLL